MNPVYVMPVFIFLLALGAVVVALLALYETRGQGEQDMVRDKMQELDDEHEAAAAQAGVVHNSAR